MKILVVLAVLSTSSLLGFPLTESDLEALIEYGQSAQVFDEVPGWIDLGSKFPKGSFMRTVAVGVSEPPYRFGIRTCIQGVPNLAFRSKLDGTAIDRAKLAGDCVGVDQVRVLVYADEAANEMVSPSMGYRPWPSLPITAVQLEVDGDLMQPIDDNDPSALGRGFAALFDAAPLRAAKKVEVVATVNSMYQLRVRVKAKQLRALFEMPE